VFLAKVIVHVSVSIHTGPDIVQVARQKTQKPQADEEVSIRVETSCSESGNPEIDLTVIQTADDLSKYAVSK
jgi:hypothetical protein